MVQETVLSTTSFAPWGSRRRRQNFESKSAQASPAGIVGDDEETPTFKWNPIWDNLG
jgi:hypothetical protein